MRRGPYLDRDRPVRQRSERTLRVWGYIVPTFSVVLFAMVITLPWGFGKGMLYVPPLLIMALIFTWTVRQPTLMPSVLVFSVGIGVDVITASPIGYWAFLYLVSYAGALHLVRWEFGWPT